MKIAEIYRSVQGEGLLSGPPSVFVGTSGCNLRCRFCDTPFRQLEAGRGGSGRRRDCSSQVAL